MSKFDNYTKAWKKDKLEKLRRKRDKITENIDKDIKELESSTTEEFGITTGYILWSTQPLYITTD